MECCCKTSKKKKRLSDRIFQILFDPFESLPVNWWCVFNETGQCWKLVSAEKQRGCHQVVTASLLFL